MRFGMDMRQQHLEWQQVVARARLAEDLGFDGAWALDHFQAMEGEGSGAIFEGMTTIAAVASATTRIRLGLLVAGVTYRHPSVLAYEAMTVDHVSRVAWSWVWGLPGWRQSIGRWGSTFRRLGSASISWRTRWRSLRG
jgi:alkanesulfonate monooxygenase SsuD/methylene tetrahydromethanopterin reductase-like flavin-dependent oxidoreductase (luciferase family)